MRKIRLCIMAVVALIGLCLMSGGGVEVGAQEVKEEHKDKNAFHADVAHTLLNMHTMLNIISTYQAQNPILHEQAAHYFKDALELFKVGIQMPPHEAQEDRDKFHVEVAHALLEMNLTLDLIKTYRVYGKMPPDRDVVHEKAAHGFKRALELFGVKIDMKQQEQMGKSKFHEEVAHALLDMSTTLDQIAVYRAEKTMPPDRDKVHEQVAHGFRKALELFGVKIQL